MSLLRDINEAEIKSDVNNTGIDWKLNGYPLQSKQSSLEPNAIRTNDDIIPPLVSTIAVQNNKKNEGYAVQQQLLLSPSPSSMSGCIDVMIMDWYVDYVPFYNT